MSARAAPRVAYSFPGGGYLCARSLASAIRIGRQYADGQGAAPARDPDFDHYLGLYLRGRRKAVVRIRERVWEERFARLDREAQAATGHHRAYVCRRCRSLCVWVGMPSLLCSSCRPAGEVPGGINFNTPF